MGPHLLCVVNSIYRKNNLLIFLSLKQRIQHYLEQVIEHTRHVLAQKLIGLLNARVGVDFDQTQLEIILV